MTEGDVLFRLRVNELGAAITRHVETGAGWTEQTECRTGFVIPGYCGNAAGRTSASTAGGEVVPVEQRSA